MIITIILGYGIYSEENTAYKNYFDIAAGIIKGTKTDLIITTGAASNKNYPGITEAQSMKDYLNDRVGDIPFLLEEQSLSTQQNVSISAKIIAKKNKIPTKIIIICDSIRLPKTIFFTLYYFNEILKLNLTEKQIYEELMHITLKNKPDFSQDVKLLYRQIDFYGIGMDRTYRDISNQIIGTLEELAFIRYPDLEKKFLEIRRKEWGIGE